MADPTDNIVQLSKSPDDEESQERDSVNTSSSSNESPSPRSSEDEEHIKPIDSGKLDILSEDFDPLAALYCKDMAMIKNIVPSAPTLDNVGVFETRYYRKGGAQQGKGNNKVGGSKGNSSQDHSSKLQENVDRPQRMFTAEQMPIQGQKKEFNNVVKFMKKQIEKGGPMAILQNCIETRRRIKVFIRGIFTFMVV